jgi:tetratricopeptide (TPR) repeat protein
MITDAHGLPMTTRSEEAARAFDAAVSDYLAYRLSARDRVAEALSADPEFGLAHCLKGCFLMLLGTRAVAPKVAEALERASLAVQGATAREQAHVAALAAWLEGDLARAGRIWEELLLEHPRDILALRLQHFNAFWMGRTDLLLEMPASLREAWDESLPGFGNLLGMMAFGLEESGERVSAERYGREAVERNGDDLWAIHAVAHVLEMDERYDAGLEWLSQPPGTWADRNPFKDHLWWHRALYNLELGRDEEVLALYDREIKVDEKLVFYLDVQNAVSLLARLQFLGVEVGDRWEKLADVAAGRIGDHAMPFTDLHHVIALCAAERFEIAEDFIASLRDLAGESSYAADTMKPLTIPVAEGLLAFYQGDYDTSFACLWPRRHALAPLGGSHAQRDLFHQYLLVAAARGGAGASQIPAALLSERHVRRPHSRLGQALLAA